MDMPSLVPLALVALVAAAAAQDLARRRIPNRLLLGGWAAALILRALAPQPLHSLLLGLGGAALGLLLFLPLYWMRGMAGGDVKLMATVGALAGPDRALAIAILSTCAGGVMALWLLARDPRRGLSFERLRLLALRLAGVPLQPHDAARATMPYAVAIWAGTLIQVLAFGQ